MAARYNAWLPPKLIYLSSCRAGLRNVFSEIDLGRCVYLRIGSKARHQLSATLNVSVADYTFRVEACRRRQASQSSYERAWRRIWRRAAFPEPPAV